MVLNEWKIQQTNIFFLFKNISNYVFLTFVEFAILIDSKLTAI